MKRLLLPISILLTLQNLPAYTLDENLVSASWLSQNKHKVKILDVRKQIHTFKDQGHIEGAILVDNKDVRVNRVIKEKSLTRLIPTQKDFDKFISQHGITSNDAIVISHQGKVPGNVVTASRLYWHFKVYGYNNVALLDGGNNAWVNEALEELIKDEKEVINKKFKSNKINNKIIADIFDVKKALNNKSIQIIDTRSLRFHIGIEKRDYVNTAGHIPNSKHFPFKFLTPLKNSTNFYSKDKLISLFKSMNINPLKPIILYCNSGFEASSVWFALHEIIGNKNVSIYDASLHEWTKDKKNPMTLYIEK